jgi:hypothetical protein
VTRTGFLLGVAGVLGAACTEAEASVQNIDVVRKFLQTPREDASFWKLLRDPRAFLAVDYGMDTDETIAQWNTITHGSLAVSYKESNIPQRPGFRLTLTLRHKAIVVPMSATRDDSQIVAMSLSELVRPFIDMRYCIDSYGNSDLCYAPLEERDWHQLDVEFGQRRIAAHFAAIPATWPAFKKILETLKPIQISG